MYIVKIKNDDAIHEIHGINEKLKTGNIVKGINCIDSFSFGILPSSEHFDSIKDLKTLVRVYNTNKARYEFYGRVLYSNIAMDSTGLISKEVICENYLGFLCDSIQEYVEEKNWTVMGLLEHIIGVHNSQVEEYKRFVIGNVNVTDPNNNVYIGIQIDNTWNVIQEKLIDKLGGEISFRVVDDVIYLDYLVEIGSVKENPIQMSKNMKAIMKEINPLDCITRVIPYGHKLRDAEDNETEKRLDIVGEYSDVNYVENAEAVALYGIRYGTIIYDDVTTQGALIMNARKYVEDNCKVRVKYSIEALDLSLLGLDISDFTVGNYHPVINPLLGIDDTVRIIKQNIDICEEIKSTIEVGDNFKTASEIQLEQAGKIKNTLQKVDRIESSTKNLEIKTDATNARVEEINQSTLKTIAEAQQAAQNAQTVAGNALTAANQAKQNAADAQTKAQSAIDSAIAATNNASKASESATAAVESVRAINNDLNTVKTDALQTLAAAIDSCTEKKIDTMTASFATQDDLKEQSIDLTSEIERTAGKIQTTLEASYARKTALTEAKVELRSQIEQTAEKIEMTVLDITDAMANTQDETVRAQIEQAKENYESAKSSLATAKSNLAQAQTNELEAIESAAIAQNALSDANAKLDEAEKALIKAQSYRDKLIAVGASTAEIEAAEADVSEAQTAVAEAETAVTNAIASADAASEAVINAKNATASAEAAVNTAQNAYNQAINGLHSYNMTAIQQTAESILLRATKKELTDSVNGIAVGARNLLRNTKTQEGDYVAGAGTILEEKYQGLSVRYYDMSSTSGTKDVVQYSGVYLEELGSQYTLSFYAKGSGSLHTFFHGANNYVRTAKAIQSNGTESTPADGNTAWTLTNEWKRYWVTWTMADTGDVSIEKYVLFRLYAGGIANICGAKLEKGNKATEWTQAPEDISTTKEMNAAIQLKANSILETVSENYQSKSGMSSYYTKTEVDTKANSITQSVSATYATKTALSDTQKELDAMTFGARNLLLNTKIDDQNIHVWGASSAPSSALTSWTNKNGVLTLNFSTTSAECYYRFMMPTSNSLFTLEAGKDYTISGKMKVATTNGTLTGVSVRSQHYISNWTGGIGEAITGDTSEWVPFECTHSIPDNATGVYFSIQAYFTGSWTGTVQLKDLKLEKGNRATDWTPAPEDMATNARVASAETRITQTETSIKNQATINDGFSKQIGKLELTAESFTVRFDTLSVGGRNLVAGTSLDTVYSGNKGSSSYKDVWSAQTIDIPDKTEYVVSFDAKADVAQAITCFFYSPNTTTKAESSTGQTGTAADGACNVTLTTSWKRYWVKWTQTAATAVKSIIVGRNSTANNIHIRAVKFEAGNQPTDWTPAPEDVNGKITTAQNTAYAANTAASNAAKTATNFMSFDDDNGLLIGNKTSGSWSGSRAQILPTEFNILSADGTKLASYQGEDIYLGIASADAKIYLCGGAGELSAVKSDTGFFDQINIKSRNVYLRGKEVRLDTSTQYYNTGQSFSNSAYANIDANSYQGSSMNSASVNMRAVHQATSHIAYINGYVDDDEAYITLDASGDESGDNGSIIISSKGTVDISGNVTINGKAASVSGHTHANLINGDGYDARVLLAYGTSGSTYYLRGNGGTDGFGYYLGTTGHRWTTVYAVNALNTSSDIRLKENISYDMDKYVAMLDLIEPMSFTWINEADNPNKKTHIAYGAQYVWKAMKEVGLSENEFAGFERTMQEDGSVYAYSLCKEEFIPILHAKIKRLEERIAEQDKLIEQLLPI